MKQSNEKRKNKGGLTASSAGICAPSQEATVFMNMPVLATGGIASFPAVPLSVQMFLHLSFSHNNLLLSDDISYDKFRCRGKISLKRQFQKDWLFPVNNSFSHVPSPS